MGNRSEAVSTRKALKCKTPGCHRPHHAHGYCQHCYDNLRKRSSGRAKGAGKTRELAGLKGRDGRHGPGGADAGTRGKAASGAVGGSAEKGETALAGPEAQKSSRLLLIKARHEAMKREIDQIREDLEAEEED